MGLDFNFAFQRAMQELEYLKDDLTLEQRKKKAYDIATQAEERGQLKQSLSETLKDTQPLSQWMQPRSAGTPQYTSQPITQLQMGTETEPFSNKSLYTNVPQNYPDQRILQTLTGQGQPYQEPLPPQAGTPQANIQMYAQGLGAGLPEGIAKELVNMQTPKQPDMDRITVYDQQGNARSVVVPKNQPYNPQEGESLIKPNEKINRAQSSDIRSEILRRFSEVVPVEKIGASMTTAGNIDETLFYKTVLSDKGKESYNYINKQAETYSQKGDTPSEAIDKAIEDNFKRLKRQGIDYDYENKRWVDIRAKEIKLPSEIKSVSQAMQYLKSQGMSEEEAKNWLRSQ